MEIAAAKPLPNQVTLELESGDRAALPVEYEWKPPPRKKCVNFGHIETQCPTIQVWKEKEKEDKAHQTGAATKAETRTTEKHPTSRSNADDAPEIEEVLNESDAESEPDNSMQEDIRREDSFSNR